MPDPDPKESRRAELERIGQERLLASREADRLYRWELVRVCAEMIGWTVLGVGVSAFAFRVTDYDLGMIFLSGGMVINWGGVAVSLWLAHRRGEERGDW
ncbi:MAG: hypothetical protein ACRENU_00190 [Gemmatimonadaceae bacterium]